jgi:two-component system NtrC family sensor kinase
MNAKTRPLPTCCPEVRYHQRVELTEARKHLARSLEQQMATAQVLGIMSRSPTDLRPVFDAILANAKRLCEGNFALPC